MKRLLLLAAIQLSMLVTAQNTKRVAILETVDKYDKVEYGVGFLIRAFITDAVNKTPGFEGYDRVDMSQINKEHDFQRTGMVSDADIKKLGEMTGASSIVVAEAAAYGNERIVVAAKIINIESGLIENSTKPKTASTNGNEMELACTELVAELLGKEENSSKSNITSNYGYVDLGLPSRTLWKSINEEMCDWDTAMSKYGNKVPSQGQWEELKNYCTWTWNGKEYKITGSNGKSIVLPAVGSVNCNGNLYAVGRSGYYWSSTPSDSKRAWNLNFSSGEVIIYSSLRCTGCSIRLVQNL